MNVPPLCEGVTGIYLHEYGVIVSDEAYQMFRNQTDHHVNYDDELVVRLTMTDEGPVTIVRSHSHRRNPQRCEHCYTRSKTGFVYELVCSWRRAGFNDDYNTQWLLPLTYLTRKNVDVAAILANPEITGARW